MKNPFLLIIFFLFPYCNTLFKAHSPIIVKANRLFTFEIPSNLGTGYQWELLDTLRFSIIQHSSRKNPDSSISTDIEKFRIHPKVKKGEYSLVFYRRRPFDPLSDTIKSNKIYQKITIQ